MQKIKLGLLFGGRSCEHEISVISARSILQAVDRDKYQVILIGVDQAGRWCAGDDMQAMLTAGKVKPVADNECITIAAHSGGNLIYTHAAAKPPPSVDVIFPVLHGTFGEDGTVQGLLELAGLAYVGCGVAAAAAAMDKALAKKIFAAASIAQANYITATAAEVQQETAGIISRATELGFPLFVKPASMGSSVGISKVNSAGELKTALKYALQFDATAVVECAMQNCREVECAILGDADAQASAVGEIIPGAEFYDYRAKYITDSAQCVVPADLPGEVTARVQQIALNAFHAIGGSGLARVDFFVHRETHAITLNEINTLPGFTPISMYPRLWQESGIEYAELINRLIKYARRRHAAAAKLQREFPGATPAD